MEESPVTNVDYTGRQPGPAWAPGQYLAVGLAVVVAVVIGTAVMAALSPVSLGVMMFTFTAEWELPMVFASGWGTAFVLELVTLVIFAFIGFGSMADVMAHDTLT